MFRRFSWPSSKPNSRRHRKNVTLRIESLETRAVFDASAFPGPVFVPPGISLQNDGVLQIRGDKRDDSAIVSLQDGQVTVSLDQTEYKRVLRGGPLVPFTAHSQQTFPAASVQKIMFSGLDGNDSFENRTSVPSEAYGGNGDDQLIGGSGPDLLDGGKGQDSLEGRSGDDALAGGAGSDRYDFIGDKLGADTLVEAPNADVDTLDFFDFATTSRIQIGGGPSLGTPLSVELDLEKLGPQVVNPDNLTLTLPNTAAFENVRGGGNDDKILGNGRANRLEGGVGNDYLDGRGGKDVLEGGTGRDTLYGGFGDDQLHGGQGNDLLRGGAGKDLLYGDTGNDSLLGGPDVDKIYGGAGFDRFLQQQHFKNKDLFNEDLLLDLVPADDSISFFADTKSSEAWGWNWGAGQWTEAEIVKSDVALGQMHARTGNVKLLERADGSYLTYYRWGALLDKAQPDADPAPLAWNGGGNLHFPDMAVNSDLDWYTQVIQHETGHNWGNSSLANWTDFLALSGWRQWSPGDAFDPNTEVKTTAYEETWVYKKSAAFANDYGKTHPWEDFATAFESYFAHEQGRPFIGDGVGPIPDKWSFIDAFLDTLA